jgi:hypothetical protein
MAHARRKFFDLAKANGSPVAARALRHIARLYRIEAKAQGKPPEVRERLRAKHAKPRLKLYHAWLVKTRATVPDGAGTAKALDYTLNRWPALIRYAETGHLPIDNNPVENTIRPIAIGKKNWLFTGSERAGKRAAVIQSLLGTAKLNPSLTPTPRFSRNFRAEGPWKPHGIRGGLRKARCSDIFFVSL